MRKLKYLFVRIVAMDYQKLFKKLKEVHSECGKSYLFLLFDMACCAVIHGAGYMDYSLFKMYELNHKERKTILTRGRNNELIRKYNQKQYISIFHNKDLFNKNFNQYLKRDWFLLNGRNEEGFRNFLKKHEEVIIKPTNNSCGEGVKKVNSCDLENRYYDLMENHQYLIEEVIKQHDKMNLLYDGSVNTIRIVSIYINGNVHIVCAYLRIGNGSFVDNFNHGGMVVPIDERKGLISMPAIDKKGNIFEKHPITDKNIVGFKIPLWNEVLELVTQMAQKIVEVKLVGWDIAISKDGPVVVEGNEFPGHAIYQLPVHRENNCGIYPKFLVIDTYKNLDKYVLSKQN